MGLVALGSLVYTIGPGLVINNVRSYNPDTGQWSEVADARYSDFECPLELVGHNGALYVFDRVGDKMEVYDVEKNIWAVSKKEINLNIVSNASLVKRSDILKNIFRHNSLF